MDIRPLDFAFELADKVWRVVKEAEGRPDAANIVGFTDLDVTRRVDRVAEDEAIKYVRRRGINALLISEESPPLRIGSKPEIAIILDPLDGSTNFVRGIPFSSISVALASPRNEEEVELLVGVVKDIIRGDVYYAEKGKGAYFNDSRLHRPATEVTDSPLIALYTYDDGERTALRTIRLNSHCTLRALGSMALELCYLAASKLDGIVDIRGRLRLQDIAAGKLILEEAGGVLTDEDGRSLDLRIGHRYSIVAADTRSRLDWLIGLLRKGEG